MQKFLQNQLSPDCQRINKAVHKYTVAKQRPDQKVAGFISYLEELETRFPPSPEIVRVSHFINALLPDIRQGILNARDDKLPETRVAAEEVAIMIESSLEKGERTYKEG